MMMMMRIYVIMRQLYRTLSLTSIAALFSRCTGGANANDCVDSFLASSAVVARIYCTRHVVCRTRKFYYGDFT